MTAAELQAQDFNEAMRKALRGGPDHVEIADDLQAMAMNRDLNLTVGQRLNLMTAAGIVRYAPPGGLKIYQFLEGDKA